MQDLIHLAIPAFIALMIVEAVASAVLAREVYEFKDAAASIAMGLGNVAIDLLAKAVKFSVLTYLHRLAIFPIGFAWWAWILLFFGDEFSYYWFHRTSHECRFIFWLWLPIIGFAPMMIMTMKAISLLYQFWIHTELVHSMGPLEAVLNTPSHHRVHHGSNPRYIDRNHGGTLIIWDKLFGTFEPENPADPVRVGLTKNIQTYNPLRIAFHEWFDIARDLRNARSWRERWIAVFGNPGAIKRKEEAASAYEQLAISN